MLLYGVLFESLSLLYLPLRKVLWLSIYSGFLSFFTPDFIEKIPSLQFCEIVPSPRSAVRSRVATIFFSPTLKNTPPPCARSVVRSRKATKFISSLRKEGNKRVTYINPTQDRTFNLRLPDLLALPLCHIVIDFEDGIRLYVV